MSVYQEVVFCLRYTNKLTNTPNKSKGKHLVMQFEAVIFKLFKVTKSEICIYVNPLCSYADAKCQLNLICENNGQLYIHR